MDRNRNESRVCKDSETKDFADRHIRPKVIRELAHIFITGDGKKFTNEEEAKNHQKAIVALHKKANELTKEQKKEKINRFLQYGNYHDVLEWILEHIDVFDEMGYAMRDWDDDIYAEEYDMQDESFWDNIDNNYAFPNEESINED
jgi:hypothetical protein